MKPPVAPMLSSLSKSENFTTFQSKFKNVNLIFNSQDLIINSPYCLPYSSCDISLENYVLDQLITPWLIFFFILITCLFDIILLLWGEILSLSLMGVKGLRTGMVTWRWYVWLSHTCKRVWFIDKIRSWIRRPKLHHYMSHSLLTSNSVNPLTLRVTSI